MIELMLQAERALSMGLVDQAEQLYWQAVESDGRNVIAVVGLAKVALARGDDRTALQFARKALDLDPEDGAASRLVERLEDLARLRTGSVPPQSAPPVGPATEVTPSPERVGAEVGTASPDATAEEGAAAEEGADTAASATTPQPETAPASPPAKRSRADIEWPATDFLGAAPSIPPRTLPARPAVTGDAATDHPATPPAATAPPSGTHPGPPPEPNWPATLPATRPLPQRPRPEPEKKKGLLGRFRKNG